MLVLWITIPFGIYIMVAFQAVTYLILTFINSIPNRKLLDYSFREQWRDIIPSMLLACIMGVIIYSIQFIGWNMYLTLCTQIISGIVIYIGLAFLCKLECFTYLLQMVKELRRKETCKELVNQ